MLKIVIGCYILVARIGDACIFDKAFACLLVNGIRLEMILFRIWKNGCWFLESDKLSYYQNVCWITSEYYYVIKHSGLILKCPRY